MKKWSRYTMSALTIVVVLAISAMQVVPVLADGEVPPPPESTEVTPPPPTEESTPDAPPVEATPEAPVVEETATQPPAPTEEPVVSTEVTPPTEQVPAEAPVAEAPAPEAETPAEVLAQLPEGTELVVLDENGEALSLASEEAEEVFYGGDPQWCPVGVTPGSASCSGPKTSFNGTDPNTNLLAWLYDNPRSVAGVIWVAYNYNDLGSGGNVEGGAPIVLNGNDFATLDLYALTIKGGWNGLAGSALTSPLTPSVFTVPLNIINWTGAVTISDIVISDVTAGTALEVKTKGNISLTNVQVGTVRDNATFPGPNAGAGAVLDNASLNLGAGTGTVTVKNSTFSYNNGGDGLNVRTAGTILLTDITAEGNNGDGANLDNCLYGLYGASACKNSSADYVTLTGTNIFADNQYDGLDVVSRGAITIYNLVANGNITGWGASLNNTYATTALGVRFIGSNQLKYNDGGLSVLSRGPITLNNVNASGNTGDNGAILQNIASTAGSVVTLTGTNIFNDNYNTGLVVNSKGIITLYNVTANGNGSGALDYGAILDNYQAGAVTTAKSVILYGVNNFNQNSGGGLQIVSRGTITLNKITANSNTGASGVSIHNTYALLTAPQNVSIQGYVTANDNDQRGLDLWSLGAITLYNLTANGNGTEGIYANNCRDDADLSEDCEVKAARNVALYGKTTASGNSGEGIHILSKGLIVLNNVLANDNLGANGIFLDNDQNGATAGVTLANLSTFSPSISNNAQTGLTIKSRGAITVKDLDAIGNGGDGVSLDNRNTTSTLGTNVIVGTLRLNWINNFDGNTGTGLTIFSKGVVTLYNLSASSNQAGSGLSVDNLGAGTPKNVSLLGASWFDGNSGNGMEIVTKGLVVLNKISASGNGEYGALVTNTVPTAVTAPPSVLLNGYGWFNGNGDDGLRVESSGLITLYNVIANGNGVGPDTTTGYGVHLDNFQLGATLARGVTLNGTNVFNGNFQDGLWVESIGIIRANNLSADGNRLSGAFLKNQWDVLDQAVILTGTNFFTNNSSGVIANNGYGLQVYSNGAITISNLNAISNFNGGAYLENESRIDLTLLPSIVTLTGTNNFLDNGNGLSNTQHGLVVESHGNITINNLNANGNDGTGAWLVNYHGFAAPTSPFIKLTGINTFLNNAAGQWGLHLRAGGLVDVTKVTADGNANGVYIGAQGNITVTCGSMTGNTAYGWQIDAATGGIITLKGVFAYGNGTNTDTSDPVTYVRACPLP